MPCLEAKVFPGLFIEVLGLGLFLDNMCLFEPLLPQAASRSSFLVLFRNCVVNRDAPTRGI